MVKTSHKAEIHNLAVKGLKKIAQGEECTFENFIPFQTGCMKEHNGRAGFFFQAIVFFPKALSAVNKRFCYGRKCVKIDRRAEEDKICLFQPCKNFQGRVVWGEHALVGSLLTHSAAAARKNADAGQRNEPRMVYCLKFALKHLTDGL